MRHTRSIASYADLVVLCLVVVLNPLSPLTPYHHQEPPHIPDKVVTTVYRRPPADSLRHALRQTEAKLEEMRYYLRSHNVTDDGYNDIARYNTTLLQERQRLQRLMAAGGQPNSHTVSTRRIPAKERPLIAVRLSRGYWRAGRYYTTPLQGRGIARDYRGRVVSALWNADTVVSAMRTDSSGIYRGQTDRHLQACGQGTLDGPGGSHQEGFWRDDRLHGFAFDSSPDKPLRAGEWKRGRYLGERMKYTAERVYGIDISRHQHEKGRRRYAIDWRQLRVTSLGHRHQTGGQTFPVSFVYIKATEGTNIRNRYYRADYLQASRQGLHVGAYHFLSLKSPATAQANYFLSNAGVRRDDLPPVLDVEPTDRQIAQIGGDEELLRRVRTWLRTVEERTGKRPILYVSQMFVNRHLRNAADIKERYNIWIARYGQYRPDVRLVYWQLCADGRVSGITGDVDINVFNGYQSQFDEFVRTGYYK